MASHPFASRLLPLPTPSSAASLSQHRDLHAARLEFRHERVATEPVVSSSNNNNNNNYIDDVTTEYSDPESQELARIRAQGSRRGERPVEVKFKPPPDTEVVATYNGKSDRDEHYRPDMDRIVASLTFDSSLRIEYGRAPDIKLPSLSETGLLNSILAPLGPSTSSSPTALSTVDSLRSPTLPTPTTSTSPTSSSRGFRCHMPECNGKEFTHKSELESHLDRHREERNYFCSEPTCPKSQGGGGVGFKRKNELVRHMHTHRGIDFQCPFCGDGKKYGRPDNLVRHVKDKHPGNDKHEKLIEILARTTNGKRRKSRTISTSSKSASL